MKSLNSPHSVSFQRQQQCRIYPEANMARIRFPFDFQQYFTYFAYSKDVKSGNGLNYPFEETSLLSFLSSSG